MKASSGETDNRREEKKTDERRESRKVEGEAAAQERVESGLHHPSPFDHTKRR